MKSMTPLPWNVKQSSVFQKKDDTIVVGVLSLQGDFLEHRQALTRIGVRTKEVRLLEDLEQINGIIFPGGESTTILQLIDMFSLRKPLITKIENGLPVWGTCAGAILLAKNLVQDRPKPLGLMDMTINRNAFGRQINSFETDVSLKELGDKPLHVDFIRSPIIEEVGVGVEILSTLEDGTVVAVKQKNMIATSFHPELRLDTRFHEYFVSLIENE
jgi:pyridoxal 5'-phosphate synthase pdxT subunit